MNKEVKEYAIEKTKELIGTPTRGGNGRGERGNETIYSGTGYPEFMKTALFIILGAGAGTALFLLGDADDSLGLSFIGFTLAVLLIMRGIAYTGRIRQGFCG